MAAELAAHDNFFFTNLRTIQDILMTFWLSGERSLPFGLLVLTCTNIATLCDLQSLHEPLYDNSNDSRFASSTKASTKSDPTESSES